MRFSVFLAGFGGAWFDFGGYLESCDGEDENHEDACESIRYVSTGHRVGGRRKRGREDGRTHEMHRAIAYEIPREIAYEACMRSVGR
eukprot:327280-Rhodomonas_salina.1